MIRHTHHTDYEVRLFKHYGGVSTKSVYVVGRRLNPDHREAFLPRYIHVSLLGNLLLIHGDIQSPTSEGMFRVSLHLD
jgi:hypothetical protein